MSSDTTARWVGRVGLSVDEFQGPGQGGTKALPERGRRRPWDHVPTPPFRFIALLLAAVLVFSSLAITEVIGASPSPSRDIVVVYDASDSRSDRFARAFAAAVAAVYPAVELRAVETANRLAEELTVPAWAMVYFFHGERQGVHVGSDTLSWSQFARWLGDSPISRHVFATCYTEALRAHLNSPGMLHTVEGETDGKILMLDALFALSALMAQSDDPERVGASETLTVATLQYALEHTSELFTRLLLPMDPMAVSLPDSSGYAGPVGYIIDAVLDALRATFQEITVGVVYAASYVRSGFGAAKGDVDMGFTLEWSLSVSAPSEDRLKGSIEIVFTVDQSGLPGKIMEALAGVTITVIGEGEFTLRLVSTPVARVEVEEWRLAITIIISKEIGFFDLLRILFPAAAAAVQGLPKKIRDPVKNALNRVIVEPYLGAGFEIYSNAAGDDDFQFTVFLGVTAYTKVPLVKLSAGFQVDLEFHFSSGGNFFVVALTAEFKADVPWPFSDLKKTWKRSWQFGPGSPEGEQMNGDTDGDGLGDDYETSIGTSPTSADTDGDGLPDGVELKEYATFPTDPDTDNDGLSDGDEVGYYLQAFRSPLGDYDGDGIPNILDPDSDGDGLTDGQEVNGVSPAGTGRTFTSNPLQEDTDGDGLRDSEEVGGGFTILVNGQVQTAYADPSSPDSDGDTLLDRDELRMNGNPLQTDTDGDGVSDQAELRLHSTSLNEEDTDADGLTDGEEIVPNISDPLLPDTDGDTLSDFDEVRVHATDPRNPDTDGDGVTDLEEVTLGEDGFLTLPGTPDSDADGLNDDEGLLHGTDPTNPDSDGDGLADGEEVNTWSSSPIKDDTDEDGLLDLAEIEYFRIWDPGFGPTSDYDGDGLAGILDFDSDDGGVGDGDEKLDGTVDPTNRSDDGRADQDGDKMPDLWEELYGLNKTDPSDNSTDIDTPLPDGLTNLQEYRNGTSPLAPDTDGDGLSDGDEVLTWLSDPLRRDSDGDGIEDLDEIGYFRQPLFDPGFGPGSDYDGDGLMGILDPDSDSDGLLDGIEAALDFSGRVLNPTNDDTDGDFLLDGEEVLQHQTDPTLPDTDGEGLSDFDEINGVPGLLPPFPPGTPVLFATDPLSIDTDADGLDDGLEILWMSDPLDPDSDDDGLRDGEEVTYFTNLLGVFPAPGMDFDGDFFFELRDADSDTDYRFLGLGLSDGEEATRGTDASAEDSDGDGLNDYVEVYGYGFVFVDGLSLIYFTDPLDPDTDKDGLEDGFEVLPPGIPINFRNQSYFAFTNPMNRDTDGDGLLDGVEVGGINITVMGQNMTVITNPMHPDTDEDRIGDLEEILGWNWYLQSTFPVEDRVVALLPGLELFEDATPPLNVLVPTTTFFPKIAALRSGYITDPVDPDTDDDGLTDGAEKYDSVSIPRIRAPTQTIPGRAVPILTVPVNPDTDGDGLTDGEEVNVHLTEPKSRDTDRDGLNDTEEIQVLGTDPHAYDTDFDQLSDIYELLMTYANSTFAFNTTDPNDPDTDQDGLPDGYEVFFWSTHPLDADTDDDLLLDGDEVFNRGTDPFLADTDNDALSDYEEVEVYDTDPLDPDFDDDGMPDGVEVHEYGTDPTDGDEDLDGVPDGWDHDLDGDRLSDYEETVIYRTNLNETDTDGDNVTDGDERDYFESWGADPAGDADKDGLPNLHDLDSDNDGLTDDAEFSNRTNPASADTDGDGLSDIDEVLSLPTDPLLADTDGDGVDDAAELARDLDPLNADTDGDLWNDGSDLDPVSGLLPNLLFLIPIAALLALLLVFRGRVVSFFRRRRGKES